MLISSELGVLKERLGRMYPASSVFTLSVKTGEGLDAWLDAVTTISGAGQKMADVDYDVYADGEAVLGWLNATVILRGRGQMNWKIFAENFLTSLGKRFDSMEAPVGHVKLIIKAGNDYVMGNLTGKTETVSIRGSDIAFKESNMTLNARVQMQPEELEAVVRDLLYAADNGQITVTPVAWRCISPGRPDPTHRYDHIVTVKKV